MFLQVRYKMKKDLIDLPDDRWLEMTFMVDHAVCVC